MITNVLPRFYESQCISDGTTYLCFASMHPNVTLTQFHRWSMLGPARQRWLMNLYTWQHAPLESEFLWHTGIARNCMTLLEKHVSKSHIWVDTKVRLYQTYVLLVLVYGSEVMTITKALAQRLDAFETGSHRKILRIPYTRHATNASAGRFPSFKYH